jgi:hypothetical protein
MYVGQSAIISEWFLNYELSMSMAISSSVPLCFSFLGGYLTPLIYNIDESFFHTFGFGFLVSCFSLLGVVFLAILDNVTEKHDKKLLEKYKKEKLLKNS